MSQVKLDYDESRWEIEILPVGDSDAVIFNIVGESAERKNRRRLEPFIKNIGRKATILSQVKNNEFIVAYEYNERFYGYDVYHIIVKPDFSSGSGVAIMQVLYDLAEVKIYKTNDLAMVFAYDDVTSEIPLIYSVMDRMSLNDWLIDLEEEWYKMVDEICIDTCNDQMAALVYGHTVGDFEMNFSIQLTEGHFKDGFRVLPFPEEDEPEDQEEKLLKAIRAKPACRSSLHKKEIHDLVSFDDVDQFIKKECSNLEAAEFYMEYGGFYIAGKKLPVLDPGCSRQTTIWRAIAKQKILEANGLVEPSTKGSKESFLDWVFVEDNKTGEEYVVKAGYDGQVYFLVDMRRKEGKSLPELLSKVYNAYTDTIVDGVMSYDQIKEINSQNEKWEEWAQAEISKIEP